MAHSGPLAKRNDQRAGHHTKASMADEVEAFSPVPVPDPEPGWHAIASDWYLSLGASVQSRFYEPSDWQTARVAAALISTTLEAEKPSANAIQAIISFSDRLNATEYARRRSRIEGKRPDAEWQEPDSTILARLKALSAP